MDQPAMSRRQFFGKWLLALFGGWAWASGAGRAAPPPEPATPPPAALVVGPLSQVTTYTYDAAPRGQLFAKDALHWVTTYTYEYKTTPPAPQ